MITFASPLQSVVFDAIRNEDYLSAFESVLDKTRGKILEIAGNPDEPSFRNTIEALESSVLELKRLELVFFNINAAATSKEIQQIAQELSPRLSEFYNDITLNEALFARVRKVFEQKGTMGLSTEEKKLLEETYKGFVRHGANLNTDKKNAYREITRELSVLTLKFEENLLDETNEYILHITDEENLSGLPVFVREAAAMEAEARKLPGWVFTLKAPSFLAFMKYADNRSLRERLFRAYQSRGFHGNDKDNQEIIKRIAALRLQSAIMLGYENYARYVIENRMAETPEKVNRFLQDLLDASMPVAKREYAEITAFARKTEPGITLQRWDWAFYAEKLRKEKYDISDEDTKPYFRLEKVEKGIFDLINKLYGLNFREVHHIPVYHPEVKTFEVEDEDGRFKALLYLDYFPRESKQGGAWMTNYMEQHVLDSKDQRPHVSLVFNFTKPLGVKPSLLTYDEVRTMLHEFGHALHSMLSECRYWSLSGTNVYRDFVELPSQILENWGEEREWLDQVAMHYETGVKMPDEMIEKIIRSRNYLSGYAFVRQLGFGLNDMAWHTITLPVEVPVADFERKAMAGAELFPVVDGTCHSTGFHHIFGGGYAAGYYGYKWAEVLDADAFSLFRERGIFDRETARSFREHILSRGGTEHPMILYKRFRGQEPSIQPLLERSGLAGPL
jgi:peptidyl-dipeptidase Dcp